MRIPFLSLRRCFSPVAGIQWVETLTYIRWSLSAFGSFSPVAGIQWVETHKYSSKTHIYYSFSPVAGIQWVETSVEAFQSLLSFPFQSRCRDSVG